MPFRYRRSYVGPLRAVIFDWAGTTVDYGSRAPMAAFLEVFRRRDVAITTEQARGPMGIAKRDHIHAIASLDAVRQQWLAAQGRPWSEADIDAMHQEFQALDIAALPEASALILGTLDAVATCRARRLKIGSCAGYSRATTTAIVEAARRQGCAPD